MATLGGGETDAVGNDVPNPIVDGELFEQDTDFPTPDDFPTTKTVKKEKHEGDEKGEKKEWMENFKSTLMVSGIVVAVIGAIFAVVKKIKEA